jgi:quercetin dioxygenase-like cupin family protein
MGDDCRDRLSLAGRALPAAFVRREVVIAPGAERPYDADEWRDALVIVKRGEVAVQCRSGGVIHFVSGDMLWLTGLPLRALRNEGAEPVVIVAVSRRINV